MKRLYLRLFALTAVVALGALAIVHAQRQLANAKPTDGDVSAAPAKGDGGDAKGDDGYGGGDAPAARIVSGQLRDASPIPRHDALSSDGDDTFDARRTPTGADDGGRYAHDDRHGDVQDTGAASSDPFGLRSARGATKYDDAGADKYTNSAEPGNLSEGRANPDGDVRKAKPGGPELADARSGKATDRPVESRDAKGVSKGSSGPSAGKGAAARPVAARGAAAIDAKSLDADSDDDTPASDRRRTEASAHGDDVPSDADTSGGEAPVADSRTERPSTGGRSSVSRTHADGAAAKTDELARPGDKQLEGLQSPSLTLEKIAPTEIQVGRPTVFEIKVQNVGKGAAHGVEVIDRVPQGTRLVSTTPKATTNDGGELAWDLGTLKAGSAVSLKIELMPLVEGPIGSVASIHFRADASAKVVATRPQLVMKVAAPKQVMIGDDVKLAITLSNPGTGTATNVVLEADIPPGLKHEAGRELEFDVGTLRPKESRTLELTVSAAKAGRIVAPLAARGDASLEAAARAELDVIAPKLEIAVNGPKRRYLDRKATYSVSVSNPGTAAAREIELVTYLPKGMKFVEANNAGTYDAKEHAVFWNLEELPAARTGDVTVVAIPTEAGEQTIRVEGKAQQGLADRKDHAVVVEGVAAVSFEIADLADPVEVGGDATYEIRVVNTGSKAATNVQVVGILPRELKATSAKGPTAFTIDGPRVAFQPIARLAPKEERVFTIRAQAAAAGDLRIRAQLTCDEMSQPVTKEESTRVFSDK